MLSKLLSLFSLFFLTLMTFVACKNEPKANLSPNDSANTTSGQASINKLQYSINADGRKWKLLNGENQEQLKMSQYILENEQPELVTELFTVIEMKDVNITPTEYFSQFITELQKRYSNTKVESKIINQQTNSLLGEWWVDGPSLDQAHHEWIRIIKKGNDIAVLRYTTMKNKDLDGTRTVWESILNSATY